VGSDLSSVPIAITGMHRSGTSMITRALHDSGLHLIGSGAEELIDAAEDNPEGFWENKAIVACNDELLEATGGAWDNPPDLPPQAVDDPRVAHVAEASTAAIMALSEHDHWGFKDPRTCLTAAYWLDLVPDLRVIVCVRHPLEVALSLKRRNQNSYSLGLSLWERYYASVLALVPADRRIVTHYDTFFSDPDGEIARLCAFAGLNPAPPRVRSDLRHHTIGVGLAEAGVGPGARALYADLCRQAGAPLAPEHPVDEGRVRRLVLDGAVAVRHADQRQEAVERLQQREADLRAEHAATESAHRTRVRDLEAHVVAVRKEAADGLNALRSVAASAARTEKAVADIDARTRATAARVETAVKLAEGGQIKKAARRAGGKAYRGTRRFVLRPGKRAVGKGKRSALPAARAAVKQLPPPTQFQLLRVENLLRRAVAEPAPTAKAVARKLAPRAKVAAKRLPPPAQARLRVARTRLLRAGKDPQAAAKKVTRRLPEPAQKFATRAWRYAARVQEQRRLGEAPPKAAPAPRGPALRHWKDAYQDMVAAAVPDGVAWLVVTPGSPKEVRDARRTAGTAFPDTRRGKPFADDLSHIAHLEALRFAGHRDLVLPEGSVAWFRRQAELRDHVVRTYRTVVDEEGAGAVYDLGAPAVEGPRSLRGEVSRLARGLVGSPAVLDWTELDLAAELSGLATFSPPSGHRLPYLDHSVDVVVVDAAHGLDEARRVASLGVITVVAGGSGVEVRAVERTATEADEDIARDSEVSGASRRPAPRVAVWSSAVAGDDTWRTQLAARAAAAGADLVIGEIDAARLADPGAYDVVVVVEPHVLPLPGTIEAAALLAAANPDSAIAGKVLRADGALEAVGGTVFFDRSVGLIAAGSPDVRAPWHEYVRAVCWAPGLVAAATSLWTGVAGPEVLTGRPFLREWCAAVWAQGGSVVYQPTVSAVRVAGDGGEPSVPLRESSWQRVLDLRPARPRDLSDGAWRFVLAHDDVEACRG
jgi:hypothetical protein